ncbi:glycosyltransferase [Glycomyces tenuis]|uniref:glycosyltransferase n=1 Tax=Glycomyces tenuis TaxID=58116 RepID=UPI0003F869F7|nr:glycosyltransferase [Glycomyces tenuis]
MKIAMVSEHASPLAAMGGEDAGGQNVHVAQLAAALTRQGHAVSVYTRRDRPEPPERAEAPDGYEVVHVEAGPPERVPKDRLLPHMGGFAQRLRDAWAAEPPDIVHAHFWMSGLAALWAADAAELPVVQTYHALGTVKRRHQGEADTSPPARVRLERDIGARCAGVIATCRDELAELADMDVPEDKVAVIPCGVDLEHFTPVGPAAGREGRHRVLAAGRLVPRKGLDTTIKALRDLPGTELLVAGGPAEGPVEGDPEARRLRRVAEETGVSDRVRMPGRIPHEEMPAQFRSADAVVCTPWYEPFGIVPLEAMACGVPVVAGAVGGMKDSVDDGVTGALVPDATPQAVAAAVRPYLEDPELLRRTGRAGRMRACALYSWDAIAAETIKAYELAAA